MANAGGENSALALAYHSTGDADRRQFAWRPGDHRTLITNATIASCRLQVGPFALPLCYTERKNG